jgi:hypothetical protein
VEALTAAELANIFWDGTKAWPWDKSEWEEELRSQTTLSASDFRNEMIYLLAFIDDSAFCIGLDEAAPIIQNAVRDAYATHLRRFAKQTACKPMPEGEWIGDSMTYLTSGEYPQPSINNDPIRNLNDRFELFGEALQRGGENRGAGECLCKVFAGFCGTLNASWVVELSIFFSETLIGNMNTVRSHCDQLRLG